MTPTPRDDPAILKEWQKKEKHLVKTMSQRQAHIKIGKEYGCHSMTIFNWLTPGYIKSNHRNVNHLGLNKQEYDTRYKRVSRHFPDYLKSLFVMKNSQFTIDTISKRLSDKVRINIHSETIEGIINKFEKQVGYSPLRKNGHGRYSLSERFYSHY